MTDHCRTYDVDGVPVLVRGSRPMTEQDQEALKDVVRAAQRIKITPEQAERQRATLARLRQRFGQCDDTCTVDCGHCKGAGR